MRAGKLGRLCIAVALLCCFIADSASADIADKLNALRTRGCAGSSASLTKLRANRDLDRVSREWSKGGRLREALARSGYRVVNSASLHVEGTRDEDKIVKTLRGNFCSALTNAEFTDAGMFRQGKDTWIVVALPFLPPDIRDAPVIGRQVLALVNEARSKPRRCGGQSFPAAGPLTLSATLTQAALRHAQDMAAHSLFEHIGSDGSKPAQRVTKAGYLWSEVAENIATGATKAEQVVDSWIKSPEHCVNIMGGLYTQMGIAYAVDPKSDGGIYWAQEFARPR